MTYPTVLKQESSSHVFREVNKGLFPGVPNDESLTVSEGVTLYPLPSLSRPKGGSQSGEGSWQIISMKSFSRVKASPELPLTAPLWMELPSLNSSEEQLHGDKRASGVTLL